MSEMNNLSRTQLSRLIDNDERAKFVLHLVEVDWPTAFELVPIAFRAVSRGSVSKELMAILMMSIKSYDAALGSPDRDRLRAFITPLVDGVTNLLLSDPPKVEVIGEIQDLVVAGLGEKGFAHTRQRVIDYLMPSDTPIGMVWRAMNKGELSV
ncbi:hypothetical protein ACRCPS_18065 [Pseudomonas aeruginosa]